MSLFFSNDTERVVRKEIVPEWIWGPPTILCPTCKVRVNNLPNKYDEVYCNNGHKSRRPR